MKLNKKLTRLALCTLAVTSISCSQVPVDAPEGKREIASLGIISSDGKVLLYFKDRDFIVVKSCEPNTVLGKTPAEAMANCQGKSNRIPIAYFKQALRNFVTKPGVSGVKPLTPEEVRIFNKTAFREADVESMKKQLDKINAFIAHYGSENADLVQRDELISSLKSYESHLRVLKKIDAEIEKGINFIIDQTTLSLKKSSSDKNQFLYNALKNFDPEMKIPCGLTGTVEERIKDCSYQASSTNSHFVLVRRSKEFSEVHLNTRTGQLWSDILPREVTQLSADAACKAERPETEGLLNGATTWRPPYIQEYTEAEADGSKSALPNLVVWQWTSSIKGLQKKNRLGYLYSANGPLPYLFNQEGYAHVRCISTGR